LAGRVLVAGIGNLFFGDDGFGPEVVRRLLAVGDLPEHARVVDYGIRGMHLAYDLLDGWDALIVVDALPDRGTPGELRIMDVGPDDVASGVLDAHGMDPGTVLASLRLLGGRLPRTVVVGCQALDVSEGIGLSAPVAAAVDAAVATVRDLVAGLTHSVGSR
jgi:hydrogenase maturation protease